MVGLSVGTSVIGGILGLKDKGMDVGIESDGLEVVGSREDGLVGPSVGRVVGELVRP